MPLWGNGKNGNNHPPKYIKTADKQALVYATNKGWVYKQPGHNTEEVLVHIANLAATLGQATINNVFFSNAANTYVQGNANGAVTVSFSQKVAVTGNPTIAVTGSAASGNAVATYSAGSGTESLTFTFTVPSHTQTISIGAQSIALGGGTILDQANNSVAASLSFTSAQVDGVRGKSNANTTISVA